MNIKYCGPAKDYSGYGEANRHDIAALVSGGIGVTTQLPSYTLELSDFGHLGQLAVSLENKEIDYDIKILHVTPNVYQQFFEVGKYHIGRVIWETDRLPLDFAKNCQTLDEIWVASDFGKKAIINSGITKPVYIIPEAIDTNFTPADIKPYIISNADDYKFYSLFEWTERKNPTTLIKAFWLEFQDEAGVSLTIKTYVDNFRPEKKAEIDSQLKLIKKELSLNYYAPIYLYTKLMDRHQVYRFHQSLDCFISTTRGEGWGIPQMEAMLMAKPIITTKCGGISDYLTDKKEAYLLETKLIPLTGNTRNQQWYCPDQKWFDTSITETRKALRWIFNNREKAKEMGLQGQLFTQEQFSLKTVGNLMAQRLIEVNNVLKANHI